MKHCNECGRELAEDELFCPVCGGRAAADEEAAVLPDEPPVDGVAPVSAEPAGFCPQCGAPLEAGSVFCPACGASAVAENAPAAAVPKAKKGLDPKRLGMLVTGVAALAVVVLAVWLVGRLLGGGPNAKFVSHHQKLIASVVDKELGAVAENFNRLATLSTDMTLTARLTGDGSAEMDMVDRILRDAAVTVQVDCNKTSAKLGGALVMDEENMVSGTVLYDKGKVGFQVPELDDAYFTANLTDLVESLSGERIEGLDKLEIPQIPEKSVEKALKTYLGIAAKAVTKDNVTAEKDSFRLSRLGKERMEGTQYTYTPEAEDIEEMLLKLAAALEKDKDIHALVKDFLGGNVALVNAALAEAGEYDDLDEALNDSLALLAEELEDNARDMGKSLERSDFTWTLWVGKGGAYKGEISMENGYSRLCYERTKNGVALWTEYGEDYEQDILLLEYEKDGKLYDGTYSVGGSTMEFRDVDTSKQSALGAYYGEYTTLQNGSELLTMEVEKGAAGGTDHVIKLGDLYNSSYYYRYSSSMLSALSNLELTLNTTDKKSTLGTPSGRKEDVSYYDAEEFAELFSDLGGEFNDIMEEISRSMGGGSDPYSYY